MVFRVREYFTQIIDFSLITLDLQSAQNFLWERSAICYWLVEATCHLRPKMTFIRIGDHHKKQRKMLNPVFSTKHMKIMIPLFYKVVQEVCGAITKKVIDQPQELDMLLWVSRTALELVGVAGLGYSFESFDEEKPPSAYTQAVKELTYADHFPFVFLP
jgi:hypothetical protein